MEAGLCDAIEGQTSLHEVDLIIFHCTIGHDLEQLLVAAKELCPTAQVIGCTCAGVIGKEGANEKLRALALMVAIASEPQEIAWGISTKLDGRTSYDQVRQMARTAA